MQCYPDNNSSASKHQPVKQQNQTGEMKSTREPIWTIRSGWRASYLILFTIQSVIATALLIWYQVTQLTTDTLIETILAIIQGIAWIGVASATTSVTITEVINGIMVIGEWMRERFVEPQKEKQRQQGLEQGLQQGHKQGLQQGHKQGLQQGHKQGLQQGLQQERKRWTQWNQRRMEAEAKGETFIEPTPDSDNGVAE